MYNLVIVGAGQLGSRHLQGLALLSCEANIYVVDKSTTSLAVAKQRFGEVKPTGNIKLQMAYLTDMLSLPESIDVAIIATTSDARRDTVEFLIKNKRVSYFILEKVLFNRLEDYAHIQDLLAEKDIKAWVNCSRRSFDFYKQLKTMLQREDFVQLTVEGTNWGLGCNAIHFIDLLAFLSACKSKPTVDVSQLDEKVLVSKRAGFIEFTGKLKGSFEEENTFQLVSRAGEIPEVFIRINSPNYRVVVDEGKGEMVIARKANGWKKKVFHIVVPFQSQLTNKIVEEILITGGSQLTGYEESMDFHTPLIEGFLLKLEEEGAEIRICNIT